MLMTPICQLAEIPNRFVCTGCDTDIDSNTIKVLCECKYCHKEYVKFLVERPKDVIDAYISPSYFEHLANTKYERSKRGIVWD